MKTLKYYCPIINLTFKFSFLTFIFILVSCNTEKQNEPLEVKKYSGSENKTSSKNESINDELNYEVEEGHNEDKESSVSPENVKDYIGKIITVKGIVSDVHVSEKVVYLNFGKKFPKNDFSGVVFSGKFSEFEDLEGFKDKLVEITGSVSVYRNKPQIILNSSDQIIILK